MIYNNLARIALAIILLAGSALGGLDPSAGTEATNLSMADFKALGMESAVESAVADAGAPWAFAAEAGTDLAVYTQQAPSRTEIEKLLPAGVLTDPPRYMYYNGDYLAWNDFSATFSADRPGLWIERAVSWSMYATLPLRGWARELLYVPAASSLTLYELYPSGFVRGYSLGFVQPGYYYIWYYADTPGRHSSVFAAGSSFSNTVIIDVYALPVYTNPVLPGPKEQCEKNPLCHYVNGNCLCTGYVEDPKKQKCEENPTCDYVNGQCYCRGFDPEDPEKQKCEENSNCDYANGQCYCRGLDPVEPMPGPVPNPNPEDQCGSGCIWSGSQCVCTGLLTGSNSGGSDDAGSDTSNIMGAIS